MRFETSCRHGGRVLLRRGRGTGRGNQSAFRHDLAGASPSQCPRAPSWAERVDAGQGIVHIDVRDGSEIANLGNFYSRVQDDVISDFLGPAIGNRRRRPVGGLPFEVEKAEIGSVALWRVYKSIPLL